MLTVQKLERLLKPNGEDGLMAKAGPIRIRLWRDLLPLNPEEGFIWRIAVNSGCQPVICHGDVKPTLEEALISATTIVNENWNLEKMQEFVDALAELQSPEGYPKPALKRIDEEP